MNNKITFVNQEYCLLVIAGALLLWTIFAWKEWRTKQKSGLWVQLLVSFVTIVSLVIIALKPAYEKEISEGHGVILTEGFQSELLDSIKAKNRDLILVDYNSEKRIKPDLDSLKSAVVLGNGIETYDLWQFQGLPITYLTAKPENGLAKLAYNKKAVFGTEISVAGKYENPVDGNFLVLSDPGGNAIDSIKFSNNKLQKFNLKAELKVAGRLVYNLIEKDSTGEIMGQEPLPIIVSENRSLSVLMINTYPTFEAKYLKNFLLSRGHKLIVRNQLTKDRYKFEYYNTSKSPIYGLTSDNLEQFDLLIMDVDSYLNMSAASRNNLQKAIAENGMGLFIQPNDYYFSLPESKSFFTFQKDAKTQINLDSNSNIILERSPYNFELSSNVVPVYLNSDIKIGASKFIGIGKVASTNLKDTYQLVLSGKKSMYDNIWTSLLQQISKKEVVNSEWEALTEYPRINEPFNFELHFSGENTRVRNSYESEIPLLQDTHVNSKWKGVDYPRNVGWNQLRIENDSTVNFDYFVFDSVQRTTLRNRLKTNANRNYFNSQKTIEGEKVKRLKEIPLVWFYFLFLLGIGYLWLKPKLAN